MTGDQASRPIQWTPELRAAANALWRILKNECRGRKAARPKPRLREDLAARGHVLDARHVDWIVCQIRNDVRFPVATLGRGVFWAVSLDELMRARRYITSRFDDLRIADRAYERKILRFGMGNRPVPAQPPVRQCSLFEPQTAAVSLPGPVGTALVANEENAP